MGFMNEFLEHHWNTMTAFLRSVASPESSGHVATYDGYVDLALELATLHLLLCDIFSSLDQVPPARPQGWLLSWCHLPHGCHRPMATPWPHDVPFRPIRPRRRSWSRYPPSSTPSGRAPRSLSPSSSAPSRGEGNEGEQESHTHRINGDMWGQRGDTRSSLGWLRSWLAPGGL